MGRGVGMVQLYLILENSGQFIRSRPWSSFFHYVQKQAIGSSLLLIHSTSTSYTDASRSTLNQKSSVLIFCLSADQLCGRPSTFHSNSFTLSCSHSPIACSFSASQAMFKSIWSRAFTRAASPAPASGFALKKFTTWNEYYALVFWPYINHRKQWTHHPVYQNTSAICSQKKLGLMIINPNVALRRCKRDNANLPFLQLRVIVGYNCRYQSAESPALQCKPVNNMHI